MEKEELRLMVKICRYYYYESLSQQQIAKKFGISRSRVSRMLSTAREEEIVEVKIHDPFSEESLLEEELMNRYNLKDVILVNTTSMSETQSLEGLVKAGAFLFESAINHDDVVGVMAGRSIQHLVQLTRPSKKKNVDVIPLVGGIGVQGAYSYANENVMELAKNMKFNYYVLNTPAKVSSLEMKSQLIQEDSIKQVTHRFKELKVALVGIGEITEDATFFKTIDFSADELKEIKLAGAVCGIGKTFLNRQGEVVAGELSERMIAISSEELHDTPLVIAIAAGEHKVEAIQASLLGQWIDILITDTHTGRKIIQNSIEKR